MFKINCKHLIFIFCGVGIISLKTYPNLLIRNGGRDYWISMIIASILIFMFFIYIIHICKKNNEFDFCNIYSFSVGNIVKYPFLFLFLLTLMLTLIESSSVLANSMNSIMLLSTPPWFILLIFSLSVTYSIKKGPRAVIIITIISISFIIFAGINLMLLSQKYKKFFYLRPILANGITLDFFICTLKCLGLYGSAFITFPFFLDITDKIKLRKYSIIALIFIIQMEIVAAIGTVSTFTYERAININYPKLMQTQLISSFGFLEGGEFFVMLQMVAGWYVKYILTFSAITLILKKLNLNHKYTIYIITIIVFMCSYIFSKSIFRLNYFLNIYMYVSLINYVLLPFIIFTIFNIKNIVKNTPAKK